MTNRKTAGTFPLCLRDPRHTRIGRLLTKVREEGPWSSVGEEGRERGGGGYKRKAAACDNNNDGIKSQGEGERASANHAVRGDRSQEDHNSTHTYIHGRVTLEHGRDNADSDRANCCGSPRPSSLTSPALSTPAMEKRLLAILREEGAIR